MNPTNPIIDDKDKHKSDAAKKTGGKDQVRSVNDTMESAATPMQRGGLTSDDAPKGKRPPDHEQ